MFTTLILFALLNSGTAPQKTVATPAIVIDGSSTVLPITSALQQLFFRQHPGIAVEASAHGTGAGMKRFAQGEITIAQASRPMSISEIETARKNGVVPHEITIGYDGITLVVHPSNTFATELTIEELKRIWSAGSTVRRWSDIRPTWPSTPVTLMGPGPEHGTTDFFSHEVTGKEKNLRTDYVVIDTDDYLALADRVAADKNALGFITYAYYVRNFKRIKALGVTVNGTTVLPNYPTITSGAYQPFSRPLFLYVALRELQRQDVELFLDFYLNLAPAVVKKVGYVPLSREQYLEQKDLLDAQIREARPETARLSN
jgi:phosphate transport system substrate-binding protein